MTNRKHYPRLRNGKLEGTGMPPHFVDEKKKIDLMTVTFSSLTALLKAFVLFLASVLKVSRYRLNLIGRLLLHQSD